MENKQDIEIYSDEIQAIISRVPNWMIQWGNTLILFLIILTLFFSWLIKYPDIVKGSITLTTENPPVKINAYASGKLTKLFLNEGDTINPGQAIAEIESSISGEAIEFLKIKLLEIDSLLEGKIQRLIFLDRNYTFGTIQFKYNELKKEYFAFQEMRKNNDYRVKQLKKLKEKIELYSNLIETNKKLVNLSTEELQNAIAKRNMNKELFEDSVISKIAFYNSESVYREKQQALAVLNNTVIQNNIEMNGYESQYLNLDYKLKEEERNMRENLILIADEIKSLIDDWQQNHLLSSPISGKLSYMINLTKNQFVKNEEILFAVIPEGEEYIGKVNIVAEDFVRVRPGQNVRIKFDSYPFFEFGQVIGTINSISQIQNQKKYRVELKLPQGLTTTFNKKLEFKPEMTGTAEIVTEEYRLLERFLHTFRKILD